MYKLNLNPFPVLKTSRLVLRSLVKEDVDEILFFRSDKRILEYLDMPAAKDRDDALAFINKISGLIQNNASVYWGISLAPEKKLIGTICLWNFSEEKNAAEIGYVLHPDFQGKGIMHEALTEVLDYGFNQLKLDEITAELSPKNLRSLRLLERNNFKRIIFSEPESPNEMDNNTVSYSLRKPVSD